MMDVGFGSSSSLFQSGLRARLHPDYYYESLSRCRREIAAGILSAEGRLMQNIVFQEETDSCGTGDPGDQIS